MKKENDSGKGIRLLYRIVYPSCVYFSLIVFILTLSLKLLGYSSTSIGIESILGILLLSVLLGISDLILFVSKLHPAIRLVIHWASFIVLYVCAMLMLGKISYIAGAMIMIIPLSVAYFIFALLAWLINKFVSKTIVRRALFPFTFYFLIGVLLEEILCYTLEVATAAPTFENLCFVCIFSVIMTVLELVLRSKMQIALKVAIHFVGTMLGIIFVYFILIHSYSHSSDALVPCVIIGAIYLLIAAIVLFARAQYNKSKNSEQKYKSQLY